jgi:hypothetical protein
MTSSWQLEVKMKAKTFLRPENESTLSNHEILPLCRLYSVMIPLRYGV